MNQKKQNSSYGSRSTIHDRGFTLIETLISIVIFSVLIYGITLLVSSIMNNTRFQSRLLDNNDQARKVASNFTNEMRNAVTAANGAYPLETVAAQQFTFYTKSGSTVNRVRYYIQGGKLYRGVIVPVNNVYNPATEVVTAVQNAMAIQAGDTIFSYFDGSYNGTGAALVQPVNPVSVRYIQINLKIYRQGSRNNVGTYNVTAGGTVRNLKTNL